VTAEFSVPAANAADMDAKPDASTAPRVLFVGGPDWADPAADALSSVASVTRVDGVADGCERLSSGRPDGVVVARSEGGVAAAHDARSVWP
jgi:hypothetical protein